MRWLALKLQYNINTLCSSCPLFSCSAVLFYHHDVTLCFAEVQPSLPVLLMSLTSPEALTATLPIFNNQLGFAEI